MNISGILDGEQVTIVSQQGSKDHIYTSYLTSAGLLKVTRKAIGIDDVENIATDAVSTEGSGGNLRTGNRTILLGNSIGIDSYGFSGGTGIEGYNKLTSAAANTYYNPSYRNLEEPLQKVLYSTTSGALTSALEWEPDWPAIGETYIDNEVTWLVSADRTNFAPVAGTFNIANQLIGQRLNPVFYVGASGRKSSYILNVARYGISQTDPDIVFFGGTWENDVSQSLGVSATALSWWDDFEAFLDEQRIAGRRIIIQTVHPSGSFNTSATRHMCDIFSRKSIEYADLYFPQVKCFELPSLLYNDVTTSAGSWVPDTSTKYLVQTSGSTGADATDGTHPQSVMRYKLAQGLSGLINDLGQEYKFLPAAPLLGQRWGNVFLSGTTGSLGAGCSGQAATGITVGRTGTTQVSAWKESRPDGQAGFVQVISATNSASSIAYITQSYTLASLGLAVGDVVDVYIEYWSKDLSDNVKIVNVELSMLNGALPNSVFSLQAPSTGQQFFGQVIKGEVRFVDKPKRYPYTITAGTTSITITVNISGYTSWNGIVKLGKINLLKR